MDADEKGAPLSLIKSQILMDDDDAFSVNRTALDAKRPLAAALSFTAHTIALNPVLV